MPALLISIPTETLHHILSYLGIFDLEAVAQTYNRRLYHVSSPILRSSAFWRKNARKMCELFPPRKHRDFLPSFPGHLPVLTQEWEMGSPYLYGEPAMPRNKYTYADLGLEKSAGPVVRTSPPDLRSWLQLDGSLAWLQPLPAKMAEEAAHYHHSQQMPVAPPEKVDALVQEAERLGLTLPEGFETFLRSKELHYRFVSGSAWFFALSALEKCPSCLDRGAGGYIVKFHYDQQSCAFAYLYLAKDGGHCVLASRDDWHSEMPWGVTQTEGNTPSKDRIFSKSACHLYSLTFEEYLVSTYYEELLLFGSELFPGLRDYISHVYRHPGEGFKIPKQSVK